jgi:uncharacterized protein YbjT (DUF2867 family)
MYAVTGITGNVGGETARALLAAGRTVRAVVRDAGKGATWAAKGCEVAVADLGDSESLARAFAGTEGVFAMVPPVFDPGLDFPEARAAAANLYAALEKARPGRVVYLSTIGAQAKESNLLTQHTIIEDVLRELPAPVTFLRPGWFMENFAWDVPSARNGAISSFLQPLDRRQPMVATADIGQLAAGLLAENWRGHRVVELEGPRRVSPQDAADAFSELLGREVRAEIVPRASWESLFRAQGMKNPEPRIRMLDGFNEGWMEFEGGQSGSRKGKVELKTVLKELIERAQ